MGRKNRSPYKNRERRRGFTLMETLVTVGIIVILIGIAIPSVITIKNSLDAKERDNYAKSIYLAAQTNLAMLRSTGDLAELHTLSGVTPHSVPATNNAAFPGSDPTGFYYVTSASADAGIFDRLLPAGSIDTTVRSRQILIEYNPVTASVCSVFYSEGSSALSYANVSRDSAARKRLKVGYYDGSGSGIGRDGSDVIGTDTEPVNLSSRTEVRFDNATGAVTLTVPLPADYAGLGLTPSSFLEKLDVKLSITGELSNAVLEDIDLKDTANPRISDPGLNGTACTFTYILDSLEEPELSFSEFESLGFLMGENVTLSAECTYHPADEQIGLLNINISDAVRHKVNPLYAGNTGSTITVANARNLQNLNLYNADEGIRLVEITSDIVWNSALSFTPISNPMLFGSAEFYTVEDAGDPVWREVQLDHPKREIETGLVVFTDVIDTDTHARIKGNNHSISGLKIADDTDRAFTGLFTYFNAKIDGLTVTGADVSGSGTATGILVGAAGYKASLTNCAVTASTLSAAAAGESYIGGLVGYAAESAVSGTTASGLTVTVSGSTEQSFVGGLVGAVDGGSVKNSSVSGTLTMRSDDAGTLTMRSDDAGCVGGAIGAEHDGAAFESVTAAVELSGWGGSTTHVGKPDNPSGYSVRVGKFIGSVESGEYKNCAGTGSSQGKDYHFLGHIDCATEVCELGTVGNFYMLSYPDFNVNEPTVSLSTLDSFKELAKPMTATTVYLCEYQAKLEGCTFLDASGDRWEQLITGCGYYRESNTITTVSNQTLDVGKDYILMSYDGTRLMYPSGKNGYNIAPWNATEHPMYKTVDSVIEDGVVYLDPELDLSKYAWEFAAPLGTNNEINLKSVSTGEYLAYNRTYDPYMSTGHRSTNVPFIGDLSRDVAFYSANPPDWTYISEGDCFWFAEYYDTVIGSSVIRTTVCLTFSGNNLIGRTMAANLESTGLLRIFFRDNYYEVPKTDFCKFRVFEVGQNGKLDTSLINNTSIDFLRANCFIGKQPVT